MFSVAPNIVLAPNMTQNANTEHRTQTLLISGFKYKGLVPLRYILIRGGDKTLFTYIRVVNTDFHS